jgi:hypothetical protein
MIRNPHQASKIAVLIGLSHSRQPDERLHLRDRVGPDVLPAVTSRQQCIDRLR